MTDDKRPAGMSNPEAYEFAQVLLAYSRGDPVQYLLDDGRWMRVTSSGLAFRDDPARYRLPPKTLKCRVWLHRCEGRVIPCVTLPTEAGLDWDEFAKVTPNFAGWLSDVLEFEP